MKFLEKLLIFRFHQWYLSVVLWYFKARDNATKKKWKGKKSDRSFIASGVYRAYVVISIIAIFIQVTSNIKQLTIHLVKSVISQCVVPTIRWTLENPLIMRGISTRHNTLVMWFQIPLCSWKLFDFWCNNNYCLNYY